jgi:hypothetical protein
MHLLFVLIRQVPLNGRGEGMDWWPMLQHGLLFTRFSGRKHTNIYGSLSHFVGWTSLSCSNGEDSWISQPAWHCLYAAALPPPPSPPHTQFAGGCHPSSRERAAFHSTARKVATLQLCRSNWTYKSFRSPPPPPLHVPCNPLFTPHVDAALYACCVGCCYPGSRAGVALHSSTCKV